VLVDAANAVSDPANGAGVKTIIDFYDPRKSK
jgi:hypothetical protein